MAHFILEYSANLDQEQLALAALFQKLHEAADASGLFPLSGIRSRAYCAENFRVAGGDPAWAFVHLNFRIGPGRTKAQQALVFEAIREVLLEHFNELCQVQGLAISLELTELPARLRHNHNNLRNYPSP